MTEGSKAGWRRWRFEQMALSVNDRVDDPRQAGVEYYVGLEHLDTDSIQIRRWGVPEDVTATKLLFQPGDIIFGRRRAYQRKLGVAAFRGIASAHSLVLRAKPDVVLPEFLPFFMQSDEFMERAERISVGSLSPTIQLNLSAIQHVSTPDGAETERTQVEEGDVLLGITGEAGIGLVALARNLDKRGFISQHIALIRVDARRFDPRFVAHALAGPHGQQQVARYNQPGAKSSMTLLDARKLKIPFVSLSQQKAAADQIEEVERSIASMSPEGAGHTSPGQRPGFGGYKGSALKGRDMGAHRHVTPFQG